MKKHFLLVILSFSFILANAQKYEDIKNLLLLSRYSQAKTDIDKAMTNAKFNSKAEAYILKASVYAGLANDEKVKGTPEANQLLADAEAAFKKYREMDPAMPFLTDPIYQNAPVNIYSGYYSAGYVDYTAKKWEMSFDKFKIATEYSDLLLEKKILTMALDTNVLILTGITAEQAKKDDEAAKYYARLADAKITGEGFETVYRYLVSYYFGKKDLASFEKYKESGRTLFPSTEFFTYDKIDFAVGLVEGWSDKITALDAMLATDPDNYKANQIMGELIYDTLNSRSENPVLPANADELEKKMIVALSKSAVVKPGSAIPFLFMGDHFINKAVKANELREAHGVEMKSRTKPGTMASKEDVAKRDLLDKQYSEALEGARDPYEKAAAIFKNKTVTTDKNQAIRDKQQYKKVVGYLSDIYANKRINSKGKPADIAKYTAEEKKWNDLYETIK